MTSQRINAGLRDALIEAAKNRGVIESVTTTGRLREIWPEVSELLPKGSETQGAMLPAICLADLNAELGLGKKEGEHDNA